MLSDGSEESANADRLAPCERSNQPNLSHERHRVDAQRSRSARSRERSQQMDVYEKLRGLHSCTARPLRSDSPSGATGRQIRHKYPHAYPGLESAVHDGWPGRGPLRSIPPSHSFAQEGVQVFVSISRIFCCLKYWLPSLNRRTRWNWNNTKGQRR